jgi:hypothetical protein
METMKIAVILFAYKRPRTLKRVLKSHYKIDADYFCFIDKSEIKKQIYSIVHNSGLYEITLRPYNYGLNRNIKDGITEIFNKGYEAAIILEDDILIKKGGLEWLKEQLEIYKHTENIGAVSLCKGKVFDQFKCWGWATWKNRWSGIDWSLDVHGRYKSGWDKHHSWDQYVAFYFDLTGQFTRCHYKGLSKHIGYFGTHYSWYSGLSLRKLFR